MPIVCLMKLLLILLSMVMTWTVESKSQVSLEDGSLVPYDIEVDYACTYQKGTVRKGDTATLSLTNLGGITVESVQVYVRSNKTAGAGTFTVYGNGLQIVSKSGSLKDWTGAFDNENYHAVSLLNQSVAGIEELVIRLAGTENSLYIQKYVITYSSAAPHTVTLMKGDEEKVVLNGVTVELPEWQTEGNWLFVGWTRSAFWNRTTLPDIIEPGTYRPTGDETLWAVYEYNAPLVQAIVTDLTDGVYLYANWTSGDAMYGAVSEGIAGADKVNVQDPNQWYEVTFDSEGLATVQLANTSCYIGYSGKQLVSEPSKWQVCHEGNKTAFYTVVNNETYILLPAIL